MIGLFMLAKAIWFTPKPPVQLAEDLELTRHSIPNYGHWYGTWLSTCMSESQSIF